MDETIFQVTMEEFKLFHKIDRTLYSILVINLQRDPFESMQTLALWLERAYCVKDIIKKVSSLPQSFINQLANEVVTCLRCIENSQILHSNYASEIPLTQNLTSKEFSILFFHQNWDNATRGIRRIVTEICDNSLSDIMEEALKINYEQTMIERNISMVPPLGTSSLIKRITELGLRGNMPPWRMKEYYVPYEERTMFVTFSKGYPIFEWEIREFFTSVFGDCIEYILMQKVKSHEQALYARIIFVMPEIVEFILKDEAKAKFSIKGKHVWMRKFVPKNRNSYFP